VNQPYLGCREFAADFRLIEAPDSEAAPIADSASLGWMLYDLDFSNRADPKPRFFNAQLQAGTVHVPAWNSPEVRG
jgi:CRISPR-associated protein Cas5d